ncbi:hypothetical protein PPERSA_11265 [Pseudocohnilembus persalinus]|uniref:Transmembrane protein n=1 Tax=Pseudocohnilembus persalinus TaxID=266149 RepID=A0A0V0Q862_PSEPJ|nr:hypothetical protein PPERSA_11265 [Pseudocohnilembus persalinus]|eukprot:KRW98419.1 hypothetical protein PPERSA_11265 [Pseudocohnilembus persalinus]
MNYTQFPSIQQTSQYPQQSNLSKSGFLITQNPQELLNFRNNSKTLSFLQPNYNSEIKQQQNQINKKNFQSITQFSNQNQIQNQQQNSQHNNFNQTHFIKGQQFFPIKEQIQNQQATKIPKQFSNGNQLNFPSTQKLLQQISPNQRYNSTIRESISRLNDPNMRPNYEQELQHQLQIKPQIFQNQAKTHTHYNNQQQNYNNTVPIIYYQQQSQQNQQNLYQSPNHIQNPNINLAINQSQSQQYYLKYHLNNNQQDDNNNNLQNNQQIYNSIYLSPQNQSQKQQQKDFINDDFISPIRYISPVVNHNQSEQNNQSPSQKELNDDTNFNHIKKTPSRYPIDPQINVPKTIELQEKQIMQEDIEYESKIYQNNQDSNPIQNLKEIYQNFQVDNNDQQKQKQQQQNIQDDYQQIHDNLNENPQNNQNQIENEIIIQNNQFQQFQQNEYNNINNYQNVQENDDKFEDLQEFSDQEQQYNQKNNHEQNNFQQIQEQQQQAKQIQNQQNNQHLYKPENPDEIFKRNIVKEIKENNNLQQNTLFQQIQEENDQKQEEFDDFNFQQQQLQQEQQRQNEQDEAEFFKNQNQQQQNLKQINKDLQKTKNLDNYNNKQQLQQQNSDKIFVSSRAKQIILVLIIMWIFMLLFELIR